MRNLQALIRSGAGSGAPQDPPIWRVEVYVYCRCYQGWDNMYILVRNVRNARPVRLSLRAAAILYAHVRNDRRDFCRAGRSGSVRQDTCADRDSAMLSAAATTVGTLRAPDILAH